ncbi:MAG: leucyl aminopeptidase family protein [Planctomycetota bacterium]|nr:leucyl aminopeptidase family protein [Planctomycetota bacterium]
MKITFAKNVTALLKGADSLLVVAPQRTLGKLPKILGQDLDKLAHKLTKNLKAGDLGATATTLTNSRQERLTVGSLPDRVSRYNCKARPECVQRVVKAAKLSDKATNAVLLVLDQADHALPTVNALARCFHLYSVKGSNTGSRGTVRVAAVDRKGKAIQIPSSTRDTAEATREAARLGDAPPTEMNPEAMVKQARKLLRGIKGVRCREIVGGKLLDNKLGGIHAVGRTAVKAPRMFVATYTPSKKSRKSRHLALVGKGITYDTGGLSMKSPTAMTTMKCDMGGSAATLGAFRIAAQEAGPHKISLVLCLAENAVGPTSYKPDDVLTMHSGKTVEVNNTDAEGRLVLADGVSYAARVLKCDTIFDAATLTGAQLIATGNNHAAIFSNDPKLEACVVAAGYSSGDMVHPLMFAPELYKREFRSSIADMKNSVRNRSNAQCSCAAQFIYWHIEDTDAKWCHVDLAGPAFIGERATGFGTALLSEAIRRL